ncbi:plasmid replication protein RepC [Aureimonas psammosilenae]|uniref:plasmid replication protein RepC n=1 Tax=Aureimonas psammosilenae TaxID=2495496 RepID=UPI0012611C66|nr:plasmid replication protein RepC [Aureimonas psammosilenae]
METHLSATPFGRRSMTLGMVAAQMRAENCPPNARVGKWPIFRAICEAKETFGLGDRALAVLSALISFLPGDELCAEDDLVVFPSNRQLSLRAHGMAPATLRRHLAVLVGAGLLIRRDSPNGKRYARKGEEGAIERAFGFDLRAILARVDEIQAAAEAATRARRELLALRETVTILRREIVKSIAVGETSGISLDWMGLRSRYLTIAAAIPRNGDRERLRVSADALADLATELRNILENLVNSSDSSANESQTERHIQDSKPKPLNESEPRPEKSGVLGAAPEPPRPRLTEKTYPLGMVLQACPDIADYARGGVANWQDLASAAKLVRPMLGISADAWEEASTVMGEGQASVVLACILQRGEAIGSAGGYLRCLTRKARDGEFSLGPVLMALLAKRRRSEEARIPA